MKRVILFLFVCYLAMGQSFDDVAFVAAIENEGGSSLLTGLVSYWPLGEASGTRDDSAGSNDLTDNNTVTQAAGKIGDAASFVAANSEYLSVADNATLDFTTAFSLSAWIYGDNLTANAAVAAKWNFTAGQRSWAFQLGPTASNMRMFIAASGEDGGDNFVDFTCNLADDTWHHVVMVYDGGLAAGSRVALYIDGAAKTPVVTGTLAASLQNSDVELRVGDFQGLDRFWQGRLDEGALWSRALTAGEVTALFNSNNGLAYPF